MNEPVNSPKASYQVPKANWSYPTDIWFGVGRIDELPQGCREKGIARPLVVTDKGLANLPIIEHLLSLLKKEKLVDAWSLFSEVDPNPNDQNLTAGITRFQEGKHDGVIAIGGGSALDLGKMIAFMSGQTRPLWDFEDIGDWWRRANSEAIFPSIAIPTTAGTGSEVGRASVITHSENHTKKIIFHPKVLPVLVICDPALTVSMPAAITAGTGMDAFVHSLEAYCSPFYHPFSQGIALEGMRLVKENLLTAFKEGNNLYARSQMMSAAAMGAIAFQKGLGAIHALSHPIGAIFHTHHGTTNAILLPYVLQANRQGVEDKLLPAISYLGISGGFNGLIDFIVEWLAELGIPEKLGGLGVDPSAIDKIAEMALVDPSMGGNPIQLGMEDLKGILKLAINHHPC